MMVDDDGDDDDGEDDDDDDWSGRAPAPCLRRKQAGGSWRHVAIFQVIGKLIQMKIMNWAVDKTMIIQSENTLQLEGLLQDWDFCRLQTYFNGE